MDEATVEQVREIIAQCKERISNYTNEIDKITKDIKEHKDADKKDKVNELEKQLKDLQAKRNDDQKRQTLAEEQLARLTDNSVSAKQDNEDQSKDSNTSRNTDINVTQGDREKNAQLAAQHPERVVDGVYYADDEALQQAKEAQEKRIQAETAQATTEAKAKAEKLAAAMKAINETLYGTDNTEVLTQLQGSVGGAELSSVLGNAVSVRARQRLLDFNKFKSDFKEPNSGKPPHNKDPFPVDLKIEEFETHQPRVKVHEITTHNHGKAAAIMGIMQFDATEKRLVRLENNMATMLRYLYRLGSRVFINCQFYGGQTTFEKILTRPKSKDTEDFGV